MRNRHCPSSEFTTVFAVLYSDAWRHDLGKIIFTDPAFFTWQVSYCTVLIIKHKYAFITCTHVIWLKCTKTLWWTLQYRSVCQSHAWLCQCYSKFYSVCMCVYVCMCVHVCKCACVCVCACVIIEVSRKVGNGCDLVMLHGDPLEILATKLTCQVWPLNPKVWSTLL